MLRRVVGVVEVVVDHDQEDRIQGDPNPMDDQDGWHGWLSVAATWGKGVGAGLGTRRSKPSTNKVSTRAQDSGEREMPDLMQVHMGN